MSRHLKSVALDLNVLWLSFRMPSCMVPSRCAFVFSTLNDQGGIPLTHAYIQEFIFDDVPSRDTYDYAILS